MGQYGPGPYLHFFELFRFFSDFMEKANPKNAKSHFLHFLDAPGSWDLFQDVLEASTSNFALKAPDLDAYVSNCVTFRRFG